MTLIITAASPQTIVQVSDRKLTFPDGRKYRDNANKAIVVWCDDAHFSVAYTRLAHIREKGTNIWTPTDRWIANSLFDLMQQPGLSTIRNLYRAFAVHAEETFAGMRHVTQDRKKTAFIFAGFLGQQRRTSFVGSLSNMRFSPKGYIKVERSFDPMQVWSLKPTMLPNEIEIQIDGRIDALFSKDVAVQAINRRTQVIHRRLERMKRSGSRSPEEIAEDLVHVVRLASNHPDYGKYIGRDCMVVGCQAGNQDYFADTYKENSIEHDTPWIVNQGMVYQASWSITEEPSSPPQD